MEINLDVILKYVSKNSPDAKTIEIVHMELSTNYLSNKSHIIISSDQKSIKFYRLVKQRMNFYLPLNEYVNLLREHKLSKII